MFGSKRLAGLLVAAGSVVLLSSSAASASPQQPADAGRSSASTAPAPTRPSAAPTRATPLGVPAGTQAFTGYYLQNVHSALCAIPEFSSQASGARIEQYTCRQPDHAETWNFYASGDGLGYEIRNLHSALCMHVVGASQATSARIEQVPCRFDGSDHAQAWGVRLSGDGLGYEFQNVHSAQCLHVLRASQALAQPLEQVPCRFDGSDHAQAWYLNEAGG